MMTFQAVHHDGSLGSRWKTFIMFPSAHLPVVKDFRYHLHMKRLHLDNTITSNSICGRRLNPRTHQDPLEFFVRSGWVSDDATSRSMKVEQGQAAFITGGGSGIGRALALALASRGVQITIIDLQTAQGEESVRLVEEEHARISYKPTDSPSAIFIRCDVTKSEELAAAYARHQDVFGRLHICINSAGVLNTKPFYEDEGWRKMIDVNLIAVIAVTSKAIQAMKGQGGMILNLSSAASFIPVEHFNVYCASKAGVAMFTRTLAKLGMGIRVNALCPEFVETPMLANIPSDVGLDFIRDNLGFVTMEKVVDAAFALLDDESKSGECMWVPSSHPTQIWPDEETKQKYQVIIKDGLINKDELLFNGVSN